MKTKAASWPGWTMLRIALTGFGPFPGVPFNASGQLIRNLVETPPRLPHGSRLYSIVLPTDWRAGMDALATFMGAVKPHIALHVGVSSRARGFVIETRAYNQTSTRADCSGQLALARCVRRGAPASVETRLPAARLLQRLRMEGIPAVVSADPGRYLCNAVMFESLNGASHAAPMAGFIHIPALGPGGLHTAASFGWPELRRGAEIILDTLARGHRRHRGSPASR
jgi:pyroglutamyl-peptidase